jgi:CHASE3 domain sensor protein
MKAKVTRRNMFLLSVPTIIVIAIAATLFWFFEKMKTADNVRMKTTLAIGSAQKIISPLVDSEMGTRGYILTYDEQFLKPYIDTKNTIENEIRRLRAISSTAETKSQVDNIAHHIKEELDFLETTISDSGK